MSANTAAEPVMTKEIRPLSHRQLIVVSVALFALSLLPRLFVMTRTTAVKPDQYWEISDSLIKDFKYRVRADASNTSRFFDRDRPTALRPPSTPFLIVALRVLTGDNMKAMSFLTAVFGSSIAVLLFFTARKLGYERAGILAGLIYAFYPPYIIMTFRTFMSEPLALYCMALLVYLAIDNRPSLGKSLLIGAIMGIGSLNRSDCLNTILLMSLFLVIRMDYPVKSLAISWMVCVGLMAPWVIRNWVVFGSPVFSTHSGFVLWQGNNPWTYGTFDNDHDDWGFNRDVENRPQLAYVAEKHSDLWEVDELTRSKYFKASVKEYVLGLPGTDPLRIATLYGGKLAYALVQPGDLARFHTQSFHWDPSIGNLTAFFSRLLLKLLCLYFLIFRRTTDAEFLLLIPLVAAIITQVIAFPLPRYEVPYFFGCIVFLAIKCEPWLLRALPPRATFLQKVPTVRVSS